MGNILYPNPLNMNLIWVGFRVDHLKFFALHKYDTHYASKINCLKEMPGKTWLVNKKIELYINELPLG